MNTVKTLLTATLLSTVLPGPASAQTKLADTLEALRQKHKIPGVALLIVDAKGIREQIQLGFADHTARRAMTVDTLVRIGSITKTFNALALLQLEAQDRLSLQASLKEVAPEARLDNPWRTKHPVRLVHLIEHTAGLGDMTREEFAHNTPLPSLLAAIHYNDQTRTTLWPPGLYAQYSNVGSGYLGYVIEQASGLPYAEYLQQQVLRPLGLNSATLHNDQQTQQRLATGYDTDGETVIPYWHMLFPPLGAINATPRAMAQLPRFFLKRAPLSEGALLDPKVIERMETPSTGLAAQAGLSYGYGLGVDQELYAGKRWYGHGGDGDGYLSHFAYQKELGQGYFLTFNAFNRKALKAFKHAVQDYLCEACKNADATQAAAVPDTNPVEEYLGRYEKQTRRFDWQPESRTNLMVNFSERQLSLTYPDGTELPLLSLGKGLYRHPKEPIASMVFVRHEGRWSLHGDFGSYIKSD